MEIVIVIVLTALTLLYILYKMWKSSHMVYLKENQNGNIVGTSKEIGDHILIDYTRGAYMNMISLLVQVRKDKHYSNDNKIVKRVYYIGYEVEKKSGKFFIYGQMEAENEKLKFSTFLGKLPCRFIVFTNEYLGFKHNKEISIIEDNSDVKYIFKPMFWQTWWEKKWSKIRVEGNKLAPYQYHSKIGHHLDMPEDGYYK